MKLRVQDGWILAVYFFVCSVLVFYTPLKFATSTFLLFIVPAVFLMIRDRKSIWRNALGALLAGPVLSFYIDFPGVTANAWSYGNLGPFLSLQIVPPVLLGITLWSYVWAWTSITWYEHFLERSREVLSPYFVWLLLFFVLGGVNLVIVRDLYPQALSFSYLSLIFGSCISVAGVFLWRGWRVLLRCLQGCMLMIAPNILFEVAGLLNGYWHFSGNYLIVFEVLGRPLPLEEMLGWMIFGSFFLFCNFELFVLSSPKSRPSYSGGH